MLNSYMSTENYFNETDWKTINKEPRSSGKAIKRTV